MKILSPMATGNGAYLVHHRLATRIKDYHICGYNPHWTLFPPLLPLFCNRSQSELIHTTPDYATFFRKESVPLVITFHNYVLDEFMRNYSNPLQNLHYATDLKWFTRRAIKQARVITSVSNFTANLVRREITDAKNIRVIHNGIDTTRFFPKHSNKRYGRIEVLYSGNLTSRKGAFLLPEIAKIIDSNVRISYTRGLRTKAFLPPADNLIDIGMIPYLSMPDLYRQMDILFMPTVREGLSLSMIEAMASGLPVVATNCSSTSELIVDGKGGYLCALGDAEEFSDKINLLAGSPRLRKEMGQFNRSRVEKMFTEDQMVEKYQQLFEETMDMR